jgi:hypothetical protein
MTEPLGTGDFQCTCGMIYRYSGIGHELTLWPQNGVRSYRSEPMHNVWCLRCGLALGHRGAKR